jgi:hypothetical protein
VFISLNRALLCAVAALSVTLAAPAAETEPPPLAMRFSDGAVVASGATAGAKVLFVGCTRRVSDYTTRTAYHTFIAQADQKGEARYVVRPVSTPPAEVPANSFWIVTDLETGRYGVAAPGGSALKQLHPGRASVAKSNNGQLNKLVAFMPYAQFALVRPGVGAWTRTAGDGGESDRDGLNNGYIEASIDDMQPIVNAAAPPKNYDKGDIVIIIDEEKLAFFVTRVGAK